MNDVVAVMSIILIIWIGLFAYLVRLDLRLTRLETRASCQSQEVTHSDDDSSG